MIGVVLAQLTTRWGQALTLVVLSMAATIAAVSVPAYSVAIDRAAVENELAVADNSDLAVSLPLLALDSAAPRTGVLESSRELPAYGEARANLRGFTPVTTAQIHVKGLQGGADAAVAYSLLARDGFCRHVRFTAGRCPVGSREAALPAALAKKTKHKAGDEVVLTPARRTEEGWKDDGPPITLTLTGVFDADDPTGPYWTLEDPLGKLSSPAILTNRTTLSTLPHRQEIVYLDAIMPRGLLTPERVPVVRSELAAAERRLTQEDPLITGLLTSIPGLLDRIEQHGTDARALLPIAAAPLIALCWFVIHLAVGHGVWGRRQEFGVVALRGTRWPTRALTVSAESLLPLLAGAAIGLAVTRLLVAVSGPSGGLVPIDRNQLIAAALAAAGTIGAAVLALRRELAAPVAQLLREVPPRSRRLTLAAVEMLVVALGVVVVIELRTLDAQLVGVMVAAPVVVILAVAMLASLAVKPVIGMLGRRSLRRGRIGPAVAAFYLARRPGSVRLLVVLALAFGTFGFAAAATDVAAQGRLSEAQQLLGAPRVLDVQQVDRAELLRAVRAADPSGRYAMAVVSAPGGDEAPPVLAVDTTRLARVAEWAGNDAGQDPARLAKLLHPAAPAPSWVGDGDLVAELRPDPLTEDGTLSVSMLLRSPTSGDQIVATFGTVSADRKEYHAKIAGCGDNKCRVTGISFSTNDTASDEFGVTVKSVKENGRDVLSPEQLATPSRWRSPGGTQVTEQLRVVGDSGGLLASEPSPQAGTEYVLRTVDTPYPLPALTAGSVPGKLLTNVDQESIRFVSRAKLNGLPGVGARGAVVDLEYAERLTKESSGASDPRVWLAADTPASVVKRLHDQGLVIVDDRTVGSLRASLEKSGAAMALQSYQLASGVTVLVGLGALALVVAVDRRTWSPGIRAMRAQGTTERTTTAAALWSYGGVVVTSAVIGALAATVAWFAAGRQLPLGVDVSLLAAWPRWAYVLVLEGVVVVVLCAGAVAGGWWQRHLVRRQQEVGG